MVPLKKRLETVAVAKGVTVKESEISCWLVSPAQRALKKICTSAQSWLKNRHQAHAQNR